MSKQQQLDAIQQHILDDKITPELAKTATQLVFGTGNPDSEIVFIGEAPGKNEDIKGEPFVGAAGKFLNEMLEMIDLKREEIYITNIVKYRPPENRDPSPEEKKAFLPYLQSQLEVIQPKVVVTLGRHSMNCFLPDLQISKVHGQPKRVRLALKQDTGDSVQVVILPLYHPAAALYNGSMRQTLIDDFALIPSIIQKIKSI
ncbi:MAG: Phage polymerase-related protein [Candidatus Saccharibacteria bacterium]|nr:Phage polymerase-related protein [Candidatus Saccharibacteria bacterium]